MSGPSPQDDAVAGGPQRPGLPEPRRTRSIGPELIAGVLVVAIVAVLGAGLLTGAAGQTHDPAGSLPTATRTPVVVPPSDPGFDPSAIQACLVVNRRLEDDGAALKAELASSIFAPANVAAIFRSLNAEVVASTTAPARLLEFRASAPVGARLTALYTSVHVAISDALDNSLRNAAAYQSAAKAVVKILADLPAIDAELRDLLAGNVTPSGGPPGSSGPSSSGPSSSPSNSPTSSPTPSRTPDGGPTPTPLASSTTGIVNPGFESGTGGPWELVVASGSSAVMSQDLAEHASGAASARVDITTAGVERASIAVRQGGLVIETGGHYVVTISARAATSREVRIRLASADGVTYATRLYTIGPEWQVLTIDSTVLASDQNAYLEVDLGRYDSTTWLDDASFSRIAATGS